MHTPSWDPAEADALWTTACGAERWRSTIDTIEHDLARVPDTELWHMRNRARMDLIGYARNRMSQQVASMAMSADQAVRMSSCLDPDALTLGFARRVATYKRPGMLLHDRDRLVRILTSRDRPVQLVIAGKAHPADQAGQEIIRSWIAFMRRPEVCGRVVFFADYDLLVAERLVQGADVWVNAPRRPWEASGTSGMKVLVNGGLNLSELDGWWAEASTPEVGWALGDGEEHGDDPAWDAAEAEALYTLLEREEANRTVTSWNLGGSWTNRVAASSTGSGSRWRGRSVTTRRDSCRFIPWPLFPSRHRRSCGSGKASERAAGSRRSVRAYLGSTIGEPACSSSSTRRRNEANGRRRRRRPT